MTKRNARKRVTIRWTQYRQLRISCRRAGFVLPTRKTLERHGVLKSTQLWGLWEIVS
jgi:hypothetical protein